MTRYFIFVVKDHLKGNVIIPASEVLANRVKYGFWSLNSKTPNFKSIKRGDKVIFYLAGKEGRKFVGMCTLASEVYPVSEVEKRVAMGLPSSTMDYVVDLREVEIWNDPVELNEVAPKLSFIKDLNKAKMYFRGGVRAIKEEDFNRIVLMGRAKNSSIT
ncbi:MAG: EVE domain-containing protein [Nitrososphaerales archaeon]|nr:EVE domain-containing protein [Nitrososphaerales archaeon]